MNNRNKKFNGLLNFFCLTMKCLIYLPDYSWINVLVLQRYKSVGTNYFGDPDNKFHHPDILLFLFLQSSGFLQESAEKCSTFTGFNHNLCKK